MPDYAPTATPRYKVQYQAAGVLHHIQVRTPRTATLVETDSIGRFVVNGLFDALADLMPDDLVFIEASLYAADSDIGVPGGLPAAVAGSVPAEDYVPIQKITHLTFSGRSNGGSPVNVKVFAPFFTEWVSPSAGLDMKINYGENASVTAAIDFLRSATDMRCIDNRSAFWRSSATLKINDFWLRLVRRGVIT